MVGSNDINELFTSNSELCWPTQKLRSSLDNVFLWKMGRKFIRQLLYNKFYRTNMADHGLVAFQKHLTLWYQPLIQTMESHSPRRIAPQFKLWVAVTGCLGVLLRLGDILCYDCEHESSAPSSKRFISRYNSLFKILCLVYTANGFSFLFCLECLHSSQA